MLEQLERPKTLKDSALAHLRQAIVLGHFKPGERLIERVLCERLQVSRTVVRECVRHLESERLVTVVPNTGPSVTVLDRAEVREIYEIRALLESAAVSSCARRADTALGRLLESRRLEIAKALGEGNLLLTLDRTRLFYRVIFEVGGRGVSWDLVERLNGRIGRLRVLTLSTKGRARSGPEALGEIVAAIARGDGDGAAEACRRHIAEACGIALARLEEEADAADAT